MRKPTLIFVLSAMVAAGASVSLVAARQAPSDAPAKQAGDDRPARGDRPDRSPGRRADAKVDVEAMMKVMSRSLKQLGPQIQDAAKRDENLRLINAMQQACVSAKGAALSDGVLARAKDDAERVKWADDYRRQMLACLRILVDVEQDILDGKGAPAKAKLDELIKLRDSSHDALGVR